MMETNFGNYFIGVGGGLEIQIRFSSSPRHDDVWRDSELLELKVNRSYIIS